MKAKHTRYLCEVCKEHLYCQSYLTDAGGVISMVICRKCRKAASSYGERIDMMSYARNDALKRWDSGIKHEWRGN